MTASSPGKILVADDDEGLLHTLGVILTDRGYEVVAVGSGQDVFSKIAAERPDLLMLDIMMPKVDGLQLLKRLKDDARWQHLPVLMMSSMAPEEATVRSLGLGAADFIGKPFRVKELTARVDSHLRAARELKAAREEAARRASEAATHAEMVDILHEVTDALAPEEVYHILTRRVANVLGVSRCSLVLAKRGDAMGTVVVAAENPMLRNLEVQLARYPEIRKALATDRPVLVADVATDPLYAEVRERWHEDATRVAIRSVIAIPFGLREEQSGVFFLRTAGDEPPLTPQVLEFAEKVVHTAVNAIEKAYALQTAETDRARYQRLATTDPLTGCLNRRALMERLAEEAKRLARYGLALSVLMIDLDRFKEINDHHGHLVGDRVLKDVGALLRGEVRAVDAVARYGGEEFVVVLPETDGDGAVRFAERLRRRVAETDFGEPGQRGVTVSVGVATASAGVTTEAESLLGLADEALYRAKHAGRNMVRA